NWSARVPDRTATFDGAVPGTVTMSASSNLERLQFSGTQAYTIDTGGQGFEINFGNVAGGGIFNSSTMAQTIDNSGGGNVRFNNGATVSGNVIITNSAAFSITEFLNSSSAGSATINNAAGGASLIFRDSSTAASSTVNNSSLMFFNDDSR